MKVFFIGTSACIPGKGEETASFLINEHILVDTGWCNVLKMKEYGFAPEKLNYLILTHLHQDHYIGLPQLLFYLGMRKADGIHSPQWPLTVIGPSEKLEYILKKTEEFLQVERFQELSLQLQPYVLIPGKIYEDENIRLETMSAKHVSGADQPEAALVCKLTDKHSSGTVCFTGDTSYHPPIADFAKGVPILIHDSCHTSADDAAATAKAAGVDRLFLIHHPVSANAEKLREAQAVFPASFLAEAGKSIEI
ncbi:MAG: MBL fold metallo-hydrolase [Victivallaceae bacterium]|nr:MBL fold metallo-hydrolase [Victivallaceae bacterium]